MRKLTKILLSFMLMICILFNFRISLATTSQSQGNSLVNATEITLYSYNREDLLEKYNITVPENLPQQFQLEVSGNIMPEFSTDADYVYVDDNGLITVSNRGNNETAEIDVKVAEKHFKVKVNLISYITLWANEILDDYINKNITSSMTEYQKLEEICKFVVNYKYDTKASSYQSYLLNGGGDCIASADCVIQMARKLGMNARLRYDADEFGAGNNHHNAIVEADRRSICY